MRSYYVSMSNEDKIGNRLFDGRGPRYSNVRRLQLVGSWPLDAPPAVICQCTVLRSLARVGGRGGSVDGGSVNAFLTAALTRVMRATVPIPAVTSVSVLHSASFGGSVVDVVGPL